MSTLPVVAPPPTSRRAPRLQVITLALAVLASTHVQAQAPEASAPTVSEDVQPRIIGTRGTMLLGVGGYVDRLFTADRETAFVYTAQVDVGRFLTRHIVVGGGIAGTGSFGGNADTLPSGPGAAATHAFGGAHWYFTPQSLASVYAGAEYWAQIVHRDGPDAGAVLAKMGLQGALSARASVFLEGGYGVGLTRNEQGSPTRVVGRFGFRIKL